MDDRRKFGKKYAFSNEDDLGWTGENKGKTLQIGARRTNHDPEYCYSYDNGIYFRDLSQATCPLEKFEPKTIQAI